MLNGQAQVKLTPSNVSYDSLAQVFAFDVNVKNLLSVTMGTTTGQDTTGLKAFFETGPSATSMRAPADSGTIFVRNPDGRENLTGSSQPYFLYRQILATNSITPIKRWELHIPPTILTFAFTLRVFTRTASNPGTGLTAPRVYSITADSLDSLYSESHLVYGHPRASGPYPRAILALSFLPAATADEREAAINLSGAQLIGGDGAFYYLLTPDDGTGNPLWAAIDRLENLPQVDYVGPEIGLVLGPASRIPNDGPPDWRRNSERSPPLR
jgi:hypothetical protein